MTSLPQYIFSVLLRAGFHLLYHQFAWSYDLVAATVSLGQWRNWVLAALPYLEGPRVLELGFGRGHLQRALWQRGLEPVGLDESLQMARFAFGELLGLGFGMMLVNGYAQFMPFSDNCFDQVVSTFPSDYISHLQTLSEAQRVLVPGGKLVVIPFAWLTGRGPIHRFLAWAFRITGQAPLQKDAHGFARLTHPFVQAGFQVETQITSLESNKRSSNVLVIIATKPASL